MWLLLANNFNIRKKSLVFLVILSLPSYLGEKRTATGFAVRKAQVEVSNALKLYHAHRWHEVPAKSFI